jgi:predicted transcriptional regulator
MKKGSPKGQKKGIEFSYKFEGDDAANYETIAVPKNHLRQGKIYDSFCIINQEFLKYILSCKLTKNEYMILMFLLSYMDKQNRIIIDAQMIEYNLNISASNVNKYISRLEEKKIIYKRNLGYRKGAEVLLNFDIISPHMAFKNKNNFDNVSEHKKLMNSDLPYIRQKNLLTGAVDLVHPTTGEVFYEE